MIVPMKKISLLVLDREREEALGALRKTGVLHVEKRPAHSERLVQLNSVLSQIDQALAVLAEVRSPNPAMDDDSKNQFPDDLVGRILALRDERKACLDTVSAVDRELDRLAPWGEIDPASFDRLADKGLYLFPFEMSCDEYRKIPDTVDSVVLSRDKKTVRCVIVSPDDLLHEHMPSGALELVLPAKSTNDLSMDRVNATERISAIGGELLRLAPYQRNLHQEKQRILCELEFETVRAGMEKIELGQELPRTGGTGLAILTGYVPESNEEDVLAASREYGWACLSRVPSAEDVVPTKLKNNPFVNLISPLLDFLGTVPGYRELDISLWFLLFFGVFFAMIFGDGGYGGILVAISVAGIFVKLRKGERPPVGLYMFLYLGLMTVAWGLITCNWFGMPSSMVPSVLRNLSVWQLSGSNPDTEAVTQNIQVLCFTLGLLQISLAHVIGVIRYRSSLKMLGELGSLAMTIGMYFVVLNLVVDAQKYPMNNVVLALVGGGFLVNFLFINFDGSVGKGILESLKNIITMCLGIVNMFGDIMSYIRLWAVGLAGTAISVTINNMAGPMLGGFIIFAGVLVLFFGHGLNYVMAVLSVIVHGVRLNTLEFSNHLGLTWSGFKYEPFSETVTK